MARPKKVITDETLDPAFYYDTEAEVIEDAKTRGFNGVDYLVIGDDGYNTAKAFVLNGKISRWSIVDEEDETIGVCGSFADAVLFLKGKDVNEYYGNND